MATLLRDETLHLAVAARTMSGGLNATTATVVKDHTEIDVVTPDWLEHSASANRLLPLEPRYVVHASASTRAAFVRWVDPWGGSHTTAASPKEFSAYWSRIPEDSGVAVLRRETDAALAALCKPGVTDVGEIRVATLHKAVLSASEACLRIAKDSPADVATAALTCVLRPGVFRGPLKWESGAVCDSAVPSLSGLDELPASLTLVGVLAYFYIPVTPASGSATRVGSWQRVRAAQLLAGGGRVAPSLDKEGVDIIVVQRGEFTSDDFSHLRAVLTSLSRDAVPVVWGEWVAESVAARSMQPLRTFLCSF